MAAPTSNRKSRTNPVPTESRSYTAQSCPAALPAFAAFRLRWAVRLKAAPLTVRREVKLGSGASGSQCFHNDITVCSLPAIQSKAVLRARPIDPRRPPTHVR